MRAVPASSGGWAGTAGYVAGIAVEPAVRDLGIAVAVTSWLMQQAGDVVLWHLQPDTDSAAGIYQRLGIVEVDGLDIYVDHWALQTKPARERLWTLPARPPTTPRWHRLTRARQ